ncbi:MAG: excinuclease ABC subunit UvrC [Spirochaetales bacterium]|nr:excinuclease ABC subunit UvrC [Spirochaetales bacterium]
MPDNEATTMQPKAVARSAPESPGVYLMRDAEGTIIYVGKAKVLKNRLSSYFTGRKDTKTRLLVSRIASIEWILTATEYEALLLENELIKKWAPKYNINLKDGKTYPVIRVTNEDFPRVFRTRRIVDDGSRYFGPFPSAEIIDQYLDLVKRLFPLRRCREMRKREAPCMYWHIGRCAAPCAGKVTREAYAERVAEVERLLSGDTEGLLSDLRERMADASRELAFEKAAGLRDAIAAVEGFRGDNRVVDFDPESRDYLAWAIDGSLADFTVFSMRGGRLAGRDLFRVRAFGSAEEAIESFVTSYYDRERPPPPTVYVSGELDAALLSEWARRELGVEAAFTLPEGKRHEAAMAMAVHNAKEDLAKRRREAGDVEALEELRKALGLEVLPARIEGFDIAHLSGKHTVASLVSFRDGVPDKKNYRHFRMRSLGGRIDDFASMREAVGRRYSGLLNEGAELPDLVLVDGGLGQVNAARGVLDALELSDIPVAGLAKENEEVWLPGAEAAIALAHDSAALRVLVAVRDETHRFATGLSRRLREKELRFPALEDLEGIGPGRAAKLMKAFGSLEALAATEPGVIAKAGGIPGPLAAAVKAAAAAAAEETRFRERRHGAQPDAPGEALHAAEGSAPYGGAPDGVDHEAGHDADLPEPGSTRD